MLYRSRTITLLKWEIVGSEYVTINTYNMWPDSDIDSSKRNNHFMGAKNKRSVKTDQ